MKASPLFPPCRSIPALVILASLPAAARGAEFAPESRVREVTVFREQALVTRAARLSLPAGEHRIVLREIPSVADPDSVRAGGSGAAEIAIGGVEVRRAIREPQASPEYQRLQKEIEDLTRQQRLLSDRKKSIGSLREFLGSLKATAGEESSKDLLTRGFAVESWQRAFDFLSARLNALADEEGGLDPKMRDLGEKIEVARRRLEQIASQGGLERFHATVLVSAPRGGDLELRLSYLAHGATWAPLYDARLDPASGKVRIAWQAQVAQNTGEDWRDVAVTLATTRPTGGIDLPRLATQRLVPGVAIAGRRRAEAADEEAEMKAFDAVNLSSPAEGMIAGAPRPPQAPPLEMARAQATRRETAVVFDLPGRLDIPSDDQPHKHLIATRDLDGTIEHRAVPRLVPGVFLAAKVKLGGEVPLLPGKVQHFVGGDLVGSSFMTERAAGEEFSLSFGADDRMKAERRLIAHRVDHRGKDDEIDYHFLTVIENHIGRDETVEVADRIPVSGDERITVTLDEETTTAGFTTDPNEPGILTWKVLAPKGGKKEITLRYRVRAPRDLPIPGLE